MALIKFVTDRILIDGKPSLIFGGDLQYFRVRREFWETILRATKTSGVNTISAYIPWVWHEVQEGHFDFDGQLAPERDLRGFLSLVRKYELSLVAKPGPYIYAEYQGFGIPLWLGTHYPDIRMVVVGQPTYPEIAVGHPKFLGLVRRWFQALIPLLKPMVVAGDLIALQLDNETGMPQYGAGPYLSDHNPETVEQLRHWLRRKYENISGLNAAWKSSYPTFDAIKPPDKPSNRTQLLDLAKFVEDYLVNYLDALKSLWRELGVDTHFYCNDIWMPAWPNHWSKKNRVASVGFDMYPKFIRVNTTLDQPFAVSFVPKIFDAMRLGGPLMGTEIGCGWLDERVNVSAVATFQKVMVSYLRGAQANFLYPIHDGVDPDSSRYVFDAAIDHEGRLSKRMDVVTHIGRFVAEWGALMAASQPLESPIAVLHNHDATRDPLEFAIDPLRTARECLDLAIDRSITVLSGAPGVFGSIVEAGYDPDVLELRRATLSDLARHAVCVFSCTGYVSTDVEEKLVAYVQGGGHLVVLGAPIADSGDSLFQGQLGRTWRPQALAVVAGAFTDLALFNLTQAAKITHPLVRFTVEKLQPVMGLIKHATRAGVWLGNTGYLEKVWGSRFVTYCQVPAGGKEILNFMGAPLGYSTPFGSGSLTFLGTLLGTHFDSPGYYLDPPERAASVSRFFGRLLRQHGVLPPVSGGMGLEICQRKVSDGLIVGIVNRRGPRPFEITLNGNSEAYLLSRHFSFRGSSAQWTGKLVGDLASEDVLVVHLSRPEH